MTSEEMEAGTQPLDALLERVGINNHALVAASTVPLTHKEVAKARKGRKLTARTQKRVVAALNATGADGTPFAFDAVFNYVGRS
ncbi:hypothetical protein BH23VER1_BH23VER1_03970 [soil metagenome]